MAWNDTYISNSFFFFIGEDEDDFEKEEGFSSATSSPVKLPPPPHPVVGNRLQVIMPNSHVNYFSVVLNRS